MRQLLKYNFIEQGYYLEHYWMKPSLRYDYIARGHIWKMILDWAIVKMTFSWRRRL